MASYAEEDVQELERLVGDAKRPAVKSLLEEQLAIVKRKVAAVAAQQQATPKPIATTKVETTDRSYTTIANYAWDSGKDAVKIYIDMADVHTIPAESVIATLTNEQKSTPGFDLRVHDLKGKNYRLFVDKLNGKATSVTAVQRQNRLIVTIKKGDTAQWSSLKASESTFTPKPALDKKMDEDPSASIMNMMKQMYDDGDEEMKRTISKAWSESRNKGPGGL